MLRLLIVRPDWAAKEQYHQSLRAEEGIYIVGRAATEEEILFALPHAELVLLDSAFGREITRSLIGLIRAHQYQGRILVAGVSEQVERLLDFIEAGATGYILEQDPDEVVSHKLHAAARGEGHISSRMAACLIKRLAQLSRQHRRSGLSRSRKRRRLAELSSRETEVLELISRGYSNQEIAQQLFIEYGTVKNHVHHILKKLNVSNRTQATSIYRYTMEVDPV